MLSHSIYSPETVSQEQFLKLGRGKPGVLTSRWGEFFSANIQSSFSCFCPRELRRKMSEMQLRCVIRRNVLVLSARFCLIPLSNVARSRKCFGSRNCSSFAIKMCLFPMIHVELYLSSHCTCSSFSRFIVCLFFFAMCGKSCQRQKK